MQLQCVDSAEYAAMLARVSTTPGITNVQGDPATLIITFSVNEQASV